ncbi:MAG: hypothetical protein FVQ79_03530, partial [Planctomycetes bacterium]|nr:hypothetical protein [Planctomycetota bacterium]
MSAQKKDKREPGKVIASVSRVAGILAGTTVGISKKTPGFSAFIKVKELTAALKSELETAQNKVSTLESELVAENRKLDTSRNKAKKTRSDLLSQIKTLQSKNESLESSLKQSKNMVRAAKVKAGKMDAHASALETEKAKAVTVCEKTKEMRSQFLSQIKTLQAKIDSLDFALTQAKNKTRGAKTKATRMSARVAGLETELDATNKKLALSQEKATETRSDLSSEIKTLQAKVESLDSALKQAKNMTRGAKTKATRMSVRVTALESELAATTARLVVAQEKASNARSEYSSQIKTLQENNESLDSALKQGKNKARGAETKVTRMSERVAGLESELAATTAKLVVAQEKTKETRSEYSSQIKTLQENNESLDSALKQGKNKARGAETKTVRMSEHVAGLESELAATTAKLVVAQEKTKET